MTVGFNPVLRMLAIHRDSGDYAKSVNDAARQSGCSTGEGSSKSQAA